MNGPAVRPFGLEESMFRYLSIVVFTGAFYLYALYENITMLQTLMKPFPMIALIASLGAGRGGYGHWILLGLVTSLVGDVFLIFDKGFIPGLTFFLAAHVCYLGAFTSASKALKPIPLLIFAAWGGVAYYLLNPHLGDMRTAVTVYMCVICLMMWRAAALANKGSYGRAAAMGAVLFGISDTLLAFNKFYQSFDLAPYLVIITYWSGQYLITQSARKR